MTFEKLKVEIANIDLKPFFKDFQGFDEYDTEDFNVVYSMNNDPGYTIAQFKTNEETQKSDKTWFVAIPMDGKMCVIDTGNEEEMCDQFFDLVYMITLGFGSIGVREKKSMPDEVVIK